MISAIVMAALIGSSATPDFFFGHKSVGYGCGTHCAPKCAPVVYSCCGCSGSVYSCYGCAGCSGCYGCYGSYYSCMGCSGCYGSTYSMGCSGCYGCYGSGNGVIIDSTSSYSSVIKGGATYGAVEVAPATKGTTGKGGEVSTGIKARVIVELPQDAKLLVDNNETNGVGARREFSTPALQVGQNYFYELTAIVEVDGKPQTMTKKLVVRAGEEAVARFEAATVVAKVQE